MKVRIRGPEGQATLTLPGTANIGDLRSQIEETTSVSDFDLHYGYPPKPLIITRYVATTKLSEIGINLDGEQLIVSERTVVPSKSTTSDKQHSRQPSNPAESTVPLNGVQYSSSYSISSPLSSADVETPSPLRSVRQPTKPPSPSQDAPELPLPSHASTIVLRIMPDDNSCLFRAFNTAFFGAGMDNMYELRSIIAQNIQANASKYSGAVLDKDPDDYCRWIQSESSWGGAIELEILSRHFDVEICSIDVQSLRTDRFNEGRPKRCILVYSGIHYDTIALSPSEAPHFHTNNPPDFDTKMFDASDASLLEGAVELCRILQGRHYYTDTAAFNVKCNICGKVTIGEKGAIEHATSTGHYDFGEG